MSALGVFGTDSLAHAVARAAGLPGSAGTIGELGVASVVVVSAEAHLDRLAPTIRQLIALGAHIVAASEEMAWPWFKHPHLSDVLNNEAIRAETSVLGIGPLAYETLPLLAAGTIGRLQEIRVGSRLGRGHCRDAVWQRLGIGLPLPKWKALRRSETVGLIGVAELTTLLAQGLGQHPRHSEIRVDVTPRADEAGNVTSVRAVGHYGPEDLNVECDIEAGLGLDGTQQVTLAGEVTTRLDLSNASGIGATAARLLHAAAHVAKLAPGLHTALDLPPGRFGSAGDTEASNVP